MTTSIGARSPESRSPESCSLVFELDQRLVPQAVDAAGQFINRLWGEML